MATDRIAHFVMDGEGNIVEWDPGAETMFGWTREEAVGVRLSELIIPERFRAVHEAGLRQYKASGKGKFIGKTIEIATLHRGGGEIPIAITISMEREGDRYRFPTVAQIVEVKPAA